MEAIRVTAEVDLTGATLIAGVMEGLEAAPGSEEVLSGVDLDLLQAAGFEAKSGEVIALPHAEARTLLLVGLGGEASYRSLKDASGNAIRKARTARVVTLLATIDIDSSTRAVVEGSLLGGYEYRSYKSEGESLQVLTIEIVDADESELTAASAMSAATMLARDWVNTPAKDKSPVSLADLMVEVANDAGIETEVWDLSRIEAERLGGLLGVAAGSDRDPQVVFLKYRPGASNRHLALVGKGITFDSGGLSIKPSTSMEEMKDDMSGAAAVVAATIGIARMGLSLEVTTIAPLTDNAIGGDATRPGDVLRPLDGPTIEVLNTDAEGRLILADGLSLAKIFKPDLTVDVATLTGAAAVALGKEVAAVFASDTEVSTTILDAASRADEECWAMPLYKGYRKSIDSNIADIKNISGTRYGGAIVAALFLAEYAGDGPWAHLDIAGPARRLETSGEFVKGASGVGVRTLIELARELAQTG